MPLSPRLRLACLAALSFAFAVAIAQAQTVYTWKDAKGVTHYSDAPPPKAATRQEVKTVPIAPAPAAPATIPTTPPAAATTTARATTTAAQAAREAAATNARCSQARANLAALQGSAPVGPDTNGDGKPDSTLGAEDRAKQAAAMQAAIQRDCHD